MDVKCPHCGTEYEVEQKDLHRYTQCEVCGKGFVIGATAGATTSGPSEVAGSPQAPRGAKNARAWSFDKGQSQGARIPRRFADFNAAQPSAESPNKKHSFKKRIISIVCIAFGAIIVCGACALGAYLYFGDEPRLKRGIAYYEKHEYSKAHALLLPLAEKKYARAQLIVGDCYANGQGVFMDMEEAVKWYRLAAEQELPEAQHRMFVCSRDGAGIERNQGNAAKWCRRAAEAGFDEAMYDMGMLYVRGIGVEKNAKSAIKWFRKGAESGYLPALYKFGQCYKLGFGVETDEDEAQKWQNKAVDGWRARANMGDTGAMVRLAELYKQGDIVELDKEEAVKWYRKAAELGDEVAQKELAFCYRNGEGVDEDQEESAKWMLKAAEKGTDRTVQWAMGRYYQEGWGVEKSKEEAVKWFERSAKKGFETAKYYLAMCYLNGEGVQKDEAKAEQLLEEAADAGEKDAKTELNRIRGERADRERRIAREKEEKRRKIERMKERELDIKKVKDQINEILSGKRQSDEWRGFDADKIAKTDDKVSVKLEPPVKTLSTGFSDMSESSAIDSALTSLEKEYGRVVARFRELHRVKNAYDEKELESRKETCAPCKGTGSVECARCKGKGEIVVNNKIPCTACGGETDDNDGGDAFSGMASAASVSGRRGRGQVRRQVACNNCRGGEIATRCGVCGGKGRVRYQEPGRLPGYIRCDSCGGTGRGNPETCNKCSGTGKVYVWQTCTICQGRGEISSGNKVTCPVCNGKCKLQCERCGGKGFTYRPKQ